MCIVGAMEVVVRESVYAARPDVMRGGAEFMSHRTVCGTRSLAL